MWIVYGLAILITCLSVLAVYIFRGMEYVSRVGTSMPIMRWIPFDEVRYLYCDNSKFYATTAVAILTEIKYLEMQQMEGFESVDELPEPMTYGWMSKHAEMFEFRLKHKLRKKRWLRSFSPREWFEPDTLPQPV